MSGTNRPKSLAQIDPSYPLIINLCAFCLISLIIAKSVDLEPLTNITPLLIKSNIYIFCYLLMTRDSTLSSYFKKMMI